ncbi:MAG TPA: DUF3072 domain-containing protein [Actinomycetota bacterium]|nr:DUF3072 domain-containing protein [Actinomycetota bacterium]
MPDPEWCAYCSPPPPGRDLPPHPDGPFGDPDEWVTGDEPMTDRQASYLRYLCGELGEEFDPGLTKAEASKRIAELEELLRKRGREPS